MDNLEKAFFDICKEVKKPELFYVCLAEKIPFYGGPEEGGWYGYDTIVHAYQEFHTLEMAENAVDKIENMVQQLNQESQQQYGDCCIHQMEFLENHGLDADFLRENDGPSNYYVYISEEIPTNHFASRTWS